MAFDPFEVRLHFLSLLRKLNASQQSIQTVTSYAAKHAKRCGEDLWDCVMEECGKGNLNIRINILYFLDTLCDPLTSLSYIPASSSASGSSSAQQTMNVLPFPAYLDRDLERLVALVVPDTREGVLNLLSTKQILDSWKARRIVNPETCDILIHLLEERRKAPPPSHPNPARASQSASAEAPTTSSSSSASRKRPHPSLSSFSRQDKLRRMEEDRERHKRLRERMWVLPMRIPGGLGSMGMAVGPGGGSNGRKEKERETVGSGQGQTAIPSPGDSASPAQSPFTPASPSSRQTHLTKTSGDVPPQSTKASESAVSSKMKVKATASISTSDSLQQLDPIEVEFDMVWNDGSELDEEDLLAMRIAGRKKRGLVLGKEGSEQLGKAELMDMLAKLRIPGGGQPSGDSSQKDQVAGTDQSEAVKAEKMDILSEEANNRPFPMAPRMDGLETFHEGGGVRKDEGQEEHQSVEDALRLDEDELEQAAPQAIVTQFLADPAIALDSRFDRDEEMT